MREIGNCWPFVVDKCIKASFQPLMLLYASASNSNAINTNLAPQAIYQVPNSTINNRARSAASHDGRHGNQLSTKSSFINKLNSLNSINQQRAPPPPPNKGDVPPDSPFAKSSTASSAYFSDYYPTGQEPEPQYISKRAVQSIIHAQAYQNTSHSNPNSGTHSSNHTNNHSSHHPNSQHSNNGGHLKAHFPITNQQRNSSSSLSDSYSTSTDQADEPVGTVDGFGNGKLYPQAPVVPIKPVFRKELRSADAGYDSYSLSSSDSYPSIGGSAVSTTVGSTSSGCSSSSSNDRNSSATNKSTLRSIQEQINEQSTENLMASQNNNSVLADSQLLELINDNGNDKNGPDSDKLINRLCSQSDILLLRSHEKERENDLKAAAVLR